MREMEAAMMRVRAIPPCKSAVQGLFLAGLVACAGPSGSDDTDAGARAYPSDFTTGKHRATGLSLEPQDQGADFDDDGEGDNNLPFVLETADGLLRDIDLSLDSFAGQIDASLHDGSLNVLLDSTHQAGVLEIGLLSGVRDEETGALSVDPRSLDEGGQPATVLVGSFSGPTAFQVTAQQAELVVPFVPDEPPALVPLERVTLSGDLTASTGTAVLTGIIPSEQLAQDVLAPMIPEDGVGGLSKESLLSTLETLSGLDTIADIDLGDGRRGVSCAFRVKVKAATWSE